MTEREKLPDPPPSERVYYRDRNTGDLAYLVMRDGKQHIKLDRPSIDIVKLFRPEQWVAEKEHRPYSRAQIARVAFEADKALCKLLGLHKAARREWESMKEDERIEWMERGPAIPVAVADARQRMFEAIMGALHPMVE